MKLRLFFIPLFVFSSILLHINCYSNKALPIPDNEVFIIYSINPNPASYKTEIAYKIPEGNYAEIVIFNISGLQVYSIQLEESQGKITISLEKFEKGIYFIGIKHNGKLHKTKKLIKN